MNGLNDGTSCFLVKDESIKLGYNSELYKWLIDNNYTSWGVKGFYVCDYIYININSKTFAFGVPGIKLLNFVGDHCISLDDFFTIIDIYKKYENKSVLKLKD